MASGSRLLEEIANEGEKEKKMNELKSVQTRLQEVMNKNKSLEEILLYTTQELQREKENSRKIVQTLTERLMESRETINKLEVENMRYKKDCMLAIELLQCNRSIDQSQVSATVRKLSDGITNPIGIHTEATENHDARIVNKVNENIQTIRPRTLSKKKAKDNSDDTRALLAKPKSEKIQENARSMSQKEKNAKVGCNNDLKRHQTEEKLESVAKLSQTVELADTAQEKLSNGPKDVQNKGRYIKIDRQYFTDECQVESEPLAGKDQSNSLKGVGLDKLKDASFKINLKSISKTGTQTDIENCQEEKSLLPNVSEDSTKQSLH